MIIKEMNDLECDSMKRYFYLLIILVVFSLAGCGKNDQMTSFIPTPIPADDDTDTEDNSESVEVVTDENTGTDEEPVVTEAPRDIHVGQTSSMYVRLDKYGAYLNIRPNAATTGEPVGFLVHAEKVEVIEIVDGWAAIVYNDKVSYVKASFLVKEKPEYLVPPTPTPEPKTTPTPIPDPNLAPPEI